MIPEFPHCDARVLHQHGECEYCDAHPEWQELRQAWGIAFTGHEPVVRNETTGWQELPCPADFNRPPGTGSDHRRWAGNVASSAEPVNESVASRTVYGRQVARAFRVPLWVIGDHPRPGWFRRWVQRASGYRLWL